MRFRALELRRYGHFSDAIIEFGDAGPQVHVIFGRNEAGKSTTRRAIAGLLFGIEERTGDAHRHDGRDLRIAATIEAAGGERIEVVRRKGRKDTLLGPDEKPIDDAVLARMLGGVNRPLYATMFSLDHDTLVAGGEALREGEGEVGESLFAAGTGLRGLHGLREQLRSEADAIFTPRASTKALNVTLREHAAATRTVRDMSLLPDKWKTLTATLAEDQSALEALETRHRELDHAIARLERLQRTIPAVVERGQTIARRDALGPVTLLGAQAPIERRDAEAAARRAEQRRRELDDRRDAIERNREALSIDQAVLDRALRIDALAEPLGVYRQGMRDRPALLAQAAAGEEVIRDLLRELGRDVTPEAIDAIRVPSETQSRIRTLARDHERLEAAVVSARDECATAERVLDGHRRERERLPVPREATALSAALDAARRHGGLEEREQALEAEARAFESDAGKRLDTLGLWSGDLVAAPALALPLAETVDRFERDLGAANRGVERARERGADIDRLIEDREAERALIGAQGSVPTREARDEARSVRESLWSAVKRAWLDDAAPGEAPETLAARYEGSVTTADGVSDALFDDAERATRFATLGAEIGAQRERRDRQEIERAALELTVRELESAWRALWSAAGIEPLPPGEMRAWLTRHAALVVSIESWRTRTGQHAQAQALVASLRDAIAAALVALDEIGPDAGESLVALVARAEAVRESIVGTEARRQQLDVSTADARRELSQRQARRERSEVALTEWRASWAGAVETLALPADATPDAAEAVLGTLSQAFKHHAEIAALRPRLELIDEQVHAFTLAVEGLVGECGRDLSSLAPDAAAEGLRERLQAAREALARRERFDEQISGIEEETRRCDEEHRAAEAALERLMAAAGCDSIAALEEAETRSSTHHALTERIAALDDRLVNEGFPVDALVAEAAEVDLDSLPGERESHERGRDELLERERALREQVGARRQEMRAMDGRADAATAAEAAESLLAGMHDQVARYARLRVAAALLERELERHRGEGQGPLIERAGEMFSRLTLDAYTGLTTGFGARDEIVLECLRAGGAPVRVEGLSDGTRDQLYLALRLASIEQHVARNEPLPLVVDDALVNFDDPRSKAAFDVLGEIAARTQVLFFTHHAHMVDLAREALPAAHCVEHDLDALTAASR